MYKCKFSVAPMMGWSDKHCRFLHRLLCQNARLYSEMIVDDAIVYGNKNKLLKFNDNEHPIALQIGGNNPQKLANAAKIGEKFGYDEINLNIGCPSDRVKSGTFGACLMRKPKLVGECIAAMKQSVNVPITVKCRLGVDEQNSEIALSELAHNVFNAKADAIWVHARKAWLNGLSPKENRELPPLDYDRVIRLKNEFPNKFIGINGGIKTFEQISELEDKVDGVMVGREAYRNPNFLMEVDKKVFKDDKENINYETLCEKMTEYAKTQTQQGEKLNNITKAMIGLFQGYRGAKQFRQVLAQETINANCDVGVIEKAFESVLSKNETLVCC